MEMAEGQGHQALLAFAEDAKRLFEEFQSRLIVLVEQHCRCLHQNQIPEGSSDATVERSKKNKRKRFFCSECEEDSDRRFNLERHWGQKHSTLGTPRILDRGKTDPTASSSRVHTGENTAASHAIDSTVSKPPANVLPPYADTYTIDSSNPIVIEQPPSDTLTPFQLPSDALPPFAPIYTIDSSNPTVIEQHLAGALPPFQLPSDALPPFAPIYTIDSSNPTVTEQHLAGALPPFQLPSDSLPPFAPRYTSDSSNSTVTEQPPYGAFSSDRRHLTSTFVAFNNNGPFIDANQHLPPDG